MINNNGAAMGNGELITSIAWSKVRGGVADGFSNDSLNNFDNLQLTKSDTNYTSSKAYYQNVHFKVQADQWQVLIIPPFGFYGPGWMDFHKDINYLIGRVLNKPGSATDLSNYTYTDNRSDVKVKGIYNMQVSSLDLPLRVVIPIQNEIFIYKYEFQYYEYPPKKVNGEKCATYYAYDYYSNNMFNEVSNDMDIYYKSKALKSDNKNIISSSLGDNNTIEINQYTAINTLKLKTRSLETLDENDLDTYTLTIEGNNYYLADGDNFNKLFNAGTFIASSSITLKDLPYVPNIKYYSVTATSGGQTYSASVTGVSSDGKGNTTILFKIFSNEKIETDGHGMDFNIEVDVDFQETVELQVSNLKFYRVEDDNYSLGVILPIRGERLKGYSLTTQEGKKYENVVKVSKKQYEYEDLNSHKYIYEPSDEAENDFIYFAYENLKNDGSDEEYIYIPNALLQIPGGTIKRVNLQEILVTTEEDGNDEYLPLKPSTKGQIKEINEDPAVSKEEKDKALSDKEKDEAFAKNVKDLTDAIANSLQSKSVEQQDVKVLYNRVREGASVTRSISSHMTQLYSVNKEIQSGSDELPTQFSNQVGEVRGFVDTLGGISNQGSNTTFYSSKILPASGNLVAVSGEEVIFAQSGDRLVTNDEGKITINGYTATISLTSDRKLKIEVDHSGLGQTLINYFTNLKYYYNETLDTRSSKKKVYDHLNQDEMKEKGIYNVNDAGDKLTYEKRVYIEDEEGNKDYGFIYAGIEIKDVSQTAKPKEYKLGDITVKYGTETITWGNYLQYVPSMDQGTSVNKGTIGFNTGSGAKMLVDNTSNTQESIDIVYKAIVKINDSERPTDRRISESNGIGGRVDLNVTLTNVDTSSPITKLYLELKALPTYKIGSVAKEESYDYKFLIKDPTQNAYYQVEMKDFNEKILPLSSSEDTTITLDEISSVTKFYLNDGIVDYYVKVNYVKREQPEISEGTIHQKAATLKDFTYSINLLDENGEQMFYSYELKNDKFDFAMTYFDASGNPLPGSVVLKDIDVKNAQTGEKIKIVDSEKSTGSYMEDENGYLMFVNSGLDQLYRVSEEASEYITDQKNEEGVPYTQQVFDKVVDSNGSQVGTLALDNNNKYVVKFTDSKGTQNLRMSGYEKYDKLNALSNIYSLGAKQFKHSNDNAAIDGLDMQTFDNIFKIAMDNKNTGNVYYIYLDSLKYEMLKTLNAKNEEIYESQAIIPQYVYQSFDWVSYKPVEISFSETVSLDKYSSSGEIKLYKDNSVTQESKAEFVQQGTNYSVFLRESGSNDNIYARAKLYQTLNESVNLHQPDALPAADIIITNDISFSNLISISGVESQTIIKNPSINIIGNGYFISFFGGSFFSRVDVGSVDKWIRDANFLGETVVDAPLLINQATLGFGSLQIINSNIYGTFANNTVKNNNYVPVIADKSQYLCICKYSLQCKQTF